MTEEKRKEIRDQALLNYQDAIENYNSHCGQVSQLMDRTKKIVKLFDENRLGLLEGPDGNHSFAESSSPHQIRSGIRGLKLPSHEELFEAIKECLEAQQNEEKTYAAAQHAGVDVGMLRRPHIDPGRIA